MHVDAFFEYLLDHPHPYWTDIPSDPNPVSESGRDGVAAEDDMALRSLLPHIKPRRGRKRPDEESPSRSPSQKPRMEPGGGDNSDLSGAGVEQLDLWTGQQHEARTGAYLFAQMNMNMANQEPSWTGDNFTQTPMTAHPYSALAPATANAFWPEPQQSEEAQSANTPVQSKTNRRHGAKVVSSAWRSGGPGKSGKTRGRPPLNRQTSQPRGGLQPASATSSTFSAFPAAQQSDSPPATFRQPAQQQEHQQHHTSPHMIQASMAAHPMITLGSTIRGAAITSAAGHSSTRMRQQQQQQSYGQGQDNLAQTGDLRMTPSRLSLQVPERIGGQVRLATTQVRHAAAPMAIVNGAVTAAGEQAAMIAQDQHHHHQGTSAGMGEQDIHVMDPFGSQSMYDLQFLQQQHHHHHSHQHIEDQPHISQDTASLYSNMTKTAERTHPTDRQSTQQRLFQQPNLRSVDTAGIGGGAGAGAVRFTDPSNRTNLDGLESLLTYDLLGAAWHNGQGNEVSACGIDEAAAVAQEIIDRVRREAGNSQSFLMNLSALAGTTWLRESGARTRVFRMGEEVEEQQQGRRSGVYEIHWNLQLGDVRSTFSLRETIQLDRPWGRGRQGEVEKEEHDDDAEGDNYHAGESMISAEGQGDNAARWRQRYRGLLDVVQEQRSEIKEFRMGVLELCRPSRSRGGDEWDASGQ